MKTGHVIILSGPSGAGKTTLHDKLLASPRFAGRIIRSISATTRSPRGDEKNGREYFFLSPKMFEYKIRAGHFLEWMKVFDRYYGTPMKNVRGALKAGKHVLLCIDVKGAALVKKKVPDAVMIFVKTPTLEELELRLQGRGTDAPESVALRLKAAAKELECASSYDHIVVNDKIETAFADLASWLEKELGVIQVR